MTPLQSSFGINQLAIVDQQPKIFTLSEMLEHFLYFRKEVVTRRTLFELAQAEAREHILNGLKIALDNIDEVIALIRKSKTGAEARVGLMAKFDLSEKQAQAILDMRLQRLTGMEIDKILEELKMVQEKIAGYRKILGDEKELMAVIRQELVDVSSQYSDERRTVIVEAEAEIGILDLIADEEMVITCSFGGYIKRSSLEEFQAQKRGGKGKKGMTTKEEDMVVDLIVASTHDTLLVFSNYGQVYWLKTYQIPASGRTTKGKAIINLLPFTEGEKIVAFQAVREYPENIYLTMITKNGIVKKSPLAAYKNERKIGIRAINIDEGDLLIDARITSGDDHILLSTKKGKAIRFDEKNARSLGRTSRGVKGITLNTDDEIVSMAIIPGGENVEDLNLLVISQHGYAKRSLLEAFRSQTRGGKGLIGMKLTDKTGDVVGARLVSSDDSLIVITKNGLTLRTNANQIPVIGRSTQGVRLVKINEKDNIVAFAKIVDEDEEVDDDNEENGEAVDIIETEGTQEVEDNTNGDDE